MQEPREIADGVERPLGDLARVVQRVAADAGRLDGSLRDGEFHLDRRQHLTDFVVQLARDAAPLFFLCGKEL